MKILAVIRTSTERQETESQKKELSDYIKTLGFVEEDIEYMEVAGASARKLNKKYIQMLEDIKRTLLEKHITSCAFWHLNRLGRVESKILEMKEFFIKNHIQVYVKNPALTLLNEDGTVNAGAEIAFSVFAVMVKQETEEQFRKTHRGKTRNAQNKRFNGGKCVHFGYRVDENNYIVPNEEEVKVVKLIYDEYSTGKYSAYTLAVELNKRGIRHRGKTITANFINRMLESTAFIGYTDSISNCPGDRNRVTHREYTPVISEELFNKCKEIRQNNIIGTATKETVNNALCTKLIKCTECGSNFINNGGRYVCYRHKMNKRFSVKCHNSVTIRQELLDELVWYYAVSQHLRQIRRPHSEVVEQYKTEKEIVEQKITECKKKLDGLEDKKNRATGLYIEGEITKKQLNKIKDKIISDRTQFDNELVEYNEELVRLDKNIYNIQHPDLTTDLNYIKALLKMESSKMKDMVFRFVNKITLKNVNIKGEKAVEINIYGVDGEVVKYLYFYYRNRNKKINRLKCVCEVVDDEIENM